MGSSPVTATVTSRMRLFRIDHCLAGSRVGAERQGLSWSQVSLRADVSSLVLTRPSSKDFGSIIGFGTVARMVLAVLYTLGSVEAHMHSFPTNLDLRFTVNASKPRRTDTMLKVVVGSLIQMTDIMGNLLKRSKVLGTFATDTIILTNCVTSGIVGVIVC